MKIFDDGKEIEQVEMHTIKTKEEMHALMIQKGFQLKSKSEVGKIQKEHSDAEAKLEAERELRLKNLRKSRADQQQLSRGRNGTLVKPDLQPQILHTTSTPPYRSMVSIYFLVAVAALFLTFGYRKRKRSLLRAK